MSALQLNTTGGNTTGGNNTASGAFALLFNTTGANNTAIGTRALFNSTGNGNIAIGFQAGTNLTSGSQNIYLDNSGASSESRTIRLGSTQTRTFIAGITTATVSGATVQINAATGQLGIATSSARYKRDITPMGSRSEGVLQLRPVTFAYKDDAQGMTHYGLIAEEVEEVYPGLVTHTETGEVQTVKYQELIPMLLNELQRQQQQLAELPMLRKELAELRAFVGHGRTVATGAVTLTPESALAEAPWPARCAKRGRGGPDDAADLAGRVRPSPPNTPLPALRNCYPRGAALACRGCAPRGLAALHARAIRRVVRPRSGSDPDPAARRLVRGMVPVLGEVS
jgi:endosialidase-like protein